MRNILNFSRLNIFFLTFLLLFQTIILAETNSQNQNWSPLKISLASKLSLPYNCNVYGADLGVLGTITPNVYLLQTAALCTKSDSLYGFQISAGRNVITNRLIGIQIAGLCSSEGTIFDDKPQNNKIFGVQVSGLATKGKDFGGIQTVGLFSKTDAFTGIQIVGLVSLSKNFTGLDISGIYSESENFGGINISGVGSKNNNFTGIEIAGLGSLSSQKVVGAQIAGIYASCGNNNLDYDLGFIKEKNTNIVDTGTVSGVQIGGLIAKSENCYGIEIGGLISDCNNKFYGISVGGLSAYAGTGLGLCISSIYSANYQGQFYGLDAAGIMTYSEYIKGVQIAFINSASNATGLQVGGVNYVKNDLIGFQVGAFNEAKNVYGVQIGAFNYCQTLRGVQIGLINNLGNPRILGLKVVPVINFCW